MATTTPTEELAASRRRGDRIRPGANRLMTDHSACTVCKRNADQHELVEVEGSADELICGRCIFTMIRKLEYSEGTYSPGARFDRAAPVLEHLRKVLGVS